MGRPKGFVMSEEQKAAMKAGREKARAEKIASGEVVVKEKKQPKEGGRIMTPEHKAAIQEGRKAARERKIAAGIPLRQSKKSKEKKETIDPKEDKPIVRITGKEKDAFDFYTPLRNALRPVRQYRLLDVLINKITSEFWMNPNWIRNTLANYVTLKIV